MVTYLMTRFYEIGVSDNSCNEYLREFYVHFRKYVAWLFSWSQIEDVMKVKDEQFWIWLVLSGLDHIAILVYFGKCAIQSIA